MNNSVCESWTREYMKNTEYIVDSWSVVTSFTLESELCSFYSKVNMTMISTAYTM